MIQGEEGNQDAEARRAAGWIAINRLNSGKFGSTLNAVITAKNQFQGYNASEIPLPDNLGIANYIWTVRASPSLIYESYLYFGNNIPAKNIYVNNTMADCKVKNSSFDYMQVGKTTMYISKQDYASC